MCILFIRRYHRKSRLRYQRNYLDHQGCWHQLVRPSTMDLPTHLCLIPKVEVVEAWILLQSYHSRQRLLQQLLLCLLQLLHLELLCHPLDLLRLRPCQTLGKAWIRHHCQKSFNYAAWSCYFYHNLPVARMSGKVVEINRNSASQCNCSFIQCHSSRITVYSVHTKHVFTSVCKDFSGKAYKVTTHITQGTAMFVLKIEIPTQEGCIDRGKLIRSTWTKKLQWIITQDTISALMFTPQTNHIFCALNSIVAELRQQARHQPCR